MSNPKRPYCARNSSCPVTRAPACRAPPVEVLGPAEAGHRQLPVVDRQLGVVADEPAEATRLRRRGEQHEVAAGPVGAEHLGSQTDRGRARCRCSAGARRCSRRSRRARCRPGATSHGVRDVVDVALQVDERVAHPRQRARRGRHGVEVDAPVDGAQRVEIDLVERIGDGGRAVGTGRAHVHDRARCWATIGTTAAPAAPARRAARGPARGARRARGTSCSASSNSPFSSAATPSSALVRPPARSWRAARRPDAEAGGRGDAARRRTRRRPAHDSAPSFDRGRMPVTNSSAATAPVTTAERPNGPPSSARTSTLNERPSESGEHAPGGPPGAPDPQRQAERAERRARSAADRWRWPAATPAATATAHHGRERADEDDQADADTGEEGVGRRCRRSGAGGANPRGRRRRRRGRDRGDRHVRPCAAHRPVSGLVSPRSDAAAAWRPRACRHRRRRRPRRSSGSAESEPVAGRSPLVDDRVGRRRRPRRHGRHRRLVRG